MNSYPAYTHSYVAWICQKSNFGARAKYPTSQIETVITSAEPGESISDLEKLSKLTLSCQNLIGLNTS